MYVRTKQYRINVLLDDIGKNRYRVEGIFKKLRNADRWSASNILQSPVREDLLSDEQYEQLVELEELDLETLKDVIISSKTGQRLSFPPRSSLRHTL